MMLEWWQAFIMCLICAFAGNWMGDSKTFIDCAERGQAQMLGAGKITCQVVKKGGAQ